MKLFPQFITRTAGLAAVAAALFALEPSAQAAPKKGHSGGGGHSGGHSSGHASHHSSGGHRAPTGHSHGGSVHHGSVAHYSGRGGGTHRHVARWSGPPPAPRYTHHHSGYRLIYTDGYYGPGYYYGPAGFSYWEPGVSFYGRIGDVPASVRVDLR